MKHLLSLLLVIPGSMQAWHVYFVNNTGRDIAIFMQAVARPGAYHIRLSDGSKADKPDKKVLVTGYVPKNVAFYKDPGFEQMGARNIQDIGGCSGSRKLTFNADGTIGCEGVNYLRKDYINTNGDDF